MKSFYMVLYWIIWYESYEGYMCYLGGYVIKWCLETCWMMEWVERDQFCTCNVGWIPCLWVEVLRVGRGPGRLTCHSWNLTDRYIMISPGNHDWRRSSWNVWCVAGASTMICVRCMGTVNDMFYLFSWLIRAM